MFCGVAAAAEHDRLAVAADVGEQLDAVASPSRLRTSIQASSVHAQRVVVAGLGHHQLVADIIRAGVEQELLFEREDLGVEIPRHRQLGLARPYLAAIAQGPTFVVKLLEKQYFTKR